MRRPGLIFLIGFSGAGKSSVGKSLARSLRGRFYDTDDMVTRKVGMSIPRIFECRGQSFFRGLEQEVIGELVDRATGRTVIALGGGAFQDSKNRRLILEAGTVIYLSCSQAELWRRLRRMNDRPLLVGHKEESFISSQTLKDRIKSMMKKRLRYYRLANITQSTTGRTVEVTVSELSKKLGRHYAKN